MKLLAKVVILLVLIKYINSNEFIAIFLQKCYGTGNPKYCNFTASCRPFNRTSKLNSMDVYFNPGVKLEAPINMELITYKRFRTVYRPHMIKIKEELCAQLANANHPYFRLLLSVKQNGNIFDPCPLEGHRYIKPQIASQSFSPLVPVGEWRMDFVVSKKVNQSDEIILSYSEFYEIKPTSATEF